jgi:polysaccharide biosynthesis protein PslG
VVTFGVLVASSSGGGTEPARAASAAPKQAAAASLARVRVTTKPASNVLRPRSTDTAPGRVGFSGSIVWYEAAEQLSFMRRARRTGVEWVREDLHWGAFEPQPGEWNWTVGDRLMRNASLAGIDVLGMVGYSAPWAASGPTIYHPPRDPAQYAEFCRRLVERYGPGGAFWSANPGLSPRPLTALEIWNEPWQSNWWRPNPSPAGYARLVRAASAAIHGANPRVKVLASGDVFQMRSDTSESLDWIRLLLAADPELFRNHVDAYSVHLYVQDRSPLDKRAQQRWRFDRALITRELAANASAAHPLWVTEFGWTTNRSHPDAVSERTQARFVRQALRRTLGEWRGFVERSFLYHWGRPESDHAGGFGPLRPDGSAKPVLGALAALLS